LGEDHESGFSFGTGEAATVESVELAVSFGIAEGAFDQRSAETMNRLRFRRCHLELVSLKNLLAFQAFDRPTRAAWAKALCGQWTTLANLPRTLKPVLDHELRIAA
jgi:hypothetical protein